jgi:hypothetical protein
MLFAFFVFCTLCEKLRSFWTASFLDLYLFEAGLKNQCSMSVSFIQKTDIPKVWLQ